VTISAQDIADISFGTTRIARGYEPDEVDDFLDRVARSVSLTERALDERKAKIESLQKELLNRPADDFPTQVITTPTRVLELAQETADRVLSEAKIQADDIRSKAEYDARLIVGEASKTADDRKAEAERLALDAERDLQTLQDQKASLRSFLDRILTSVINSLDDHTNINNPQG
jgi:cell division initiation protein